MKNTITVKLDKETSEKLGEIINKTDLTQSEVIRRAILHYNISLKLESLEKLITSKDSKIFRELNTIENFLQSLKAESNQSFDKIHNGINKVFKNQTTIFKALEEISSNSTVIVKRLEDKFLLCLFLLIILIGLEIINLLR